ncbi:hypothetical protein [Streptomyces afghaniensis 772] [Streptomyces afghaniensis]|uniref:hypothetical protein n=1 Tax=Streptomyces afghaniensis TaxID=66865 RepID=UPI0009EA24BD|nr:hypothetical protein [Streptomyces afghaniensis]
MRATQLPHPEQRGYAFTAAGTAARLNRELTPELYAVLRREGPKGLAEDAINDTLTRDGAEQGGGLVAAVRGRRRGDAAGGARASFPALILFPTAA